MTAKNLFSQMSLHKGLRRAVLAVLGAGLIAGGLSACGHAGPYRGDMSQMSAEDVSRMRQRMSDRVSSRLDLDAAQKQRLGVVFDRLADQRQALIGNDGSPRAKARALLAGNTFDRAGAQLLVDQKTAAVKSGSPELITAFGDFFDGLRPDQQQKVREWMDKRGGHRWFGRQGDRGAPAPAGGNTAPKQ